jgi:3-dehydroquinate dehydratase type I
VAYADVEWPAPGELLADLMASRGKTQIIMSHHILDHTPPLSELLGILDNMTKMRPDLIKIVTLARTPDDVFTLFGLLSRARKSHTPVIAHCMGELGRISRALSPFFGSFLTYASPTGGKPSAPGQMSATELRRIWEIIGAEDAGAPAAEFEAAP